MGFKVSEISESLPEEDSPEQKCSTSYLTRSQKSVSRAESILFFFPGYEIDVLTK